MSWWSPPIPPRRPSSTGSASIFAATATARSSRHAPRSTSTSTRSPPEWTGSTSTRRARGRCSTRPLWRRTSSTPITATCRRSCRWSMHSRPRCWRSMVRGIPSSSAVRRLVAELGSGSAAIIDTDDLVPGNLTVTKTIAGPAAGQQGPIAILIDCGVLPNVYAFLIAPGEPGRPVPHAVNGIPAGSTCVVTEVVDGGTSTVSVVGVGSGQSVAVGRRHRNGRPHQHLRSRGDADHCDADHPDNDRAGTDHPADPTPTPAPTTPTSGPTILPSTGNSDGGGIAVVGLSLRCARRRLRYTARPRRPADSFARRVGRPQESGRHWGRTWRR